jgi:hypothetical protein
LQALIGSLIIILDPIQSDASLYADFLSWKTGKTYVVYQERMTWNVGKKRYVKLQNCSRCVHVTRHFVEKQPWNLWSTEEILNPLSDVERIMRQVPAECMHGYKGSDQTLWVGRLENGDYVWVENDSWCLFVDLLPEIGWDYDEETNLDPSWWAYKCPSHCIAWG